MSNTFPVKAQYYQQFDADHTLEVPGEAYTGWQETTLDLSSKHTAIVCMHAWDNGTSEKFPGWWRAVEYAPRAAEICKTVIPPLFETVRASKLRLYHVVGGGDYYKDYPGYKRAVELAPEVEAPQCGAAWDDTARAMRQFKTDNVFVGKHNSADCNAGFAELDFAPGAFPMGDEGIAENAEQLAALCRADGINHLIYCGFAINWCLLKSPGGMVDMSRRNVMCSAIRQAVTAVENKESARDELCKEMALWRVALAFGFVFDVEELKTALPSK